MRRCFIYLIKLLSLFVGYIMPRVKRKIIFGAWSGKSYSDNPKYLYEYFFDKPDWMIVWVGGNGVDCSMLPRLPKNARFCHMNSFSCIWHSLTSATWVFSHAPEDITSLPLWGKALLLDASHGIALKGLGRACPANDDKSIRKSSLLSKLYAHLTKRKIYLVMPSSVQGRNVLNGYPGTFVEPILPFGSPTVDFVLANKGNEALKLAFKRKFAEIFELPVDKKWIIYAPTFRWTKKDNFSFHNLVGRERDMLCNVLQSTGSILVEKLHPSVVISQKSRISGSIYSLDGVKAQNIEPLEMWLACEAVISDYSSVVMFFYLQKKPVVHFVYDLDYYVASDSGLVYPMDDIRFGPLARNIDELCARLASLEDCRGKCGPKAMSLIEYEDGHSCDKYIRHIADRHSVELQKE